MYKNYGVNAGLGFCIEPHSNKYFSSDIVETERNPKPEVHITNDNEFLSDVIFTADQIGDELDPMDWIVEDVMSTEACFGLYGLPGEGKSYAAIQLAISISSGTIEDWLGYKISKHGPVLYILNDGSMRSLKNRIRNISNYLHVTKPSDLMVLKKQGVFSAWEHTVERIIELKKPIMIVVDSLSMVTNSTDENAVSEQIDFGGTLNTWSQKYNLNVLTIHHSNKASIDRTMHLANWRGSSFWSGMLSSMMEFRRLGDSGHNIYKVVKSRDGGEDAMKVRECVYQKGVRRDGSYDFDATKPPSGYRYVGLSSESTSASKPQVIKTTFNFNVDDIFPKPDPGEIVAPRTSKVAVEAIQSKYLCSRNTALDALKEWVENGDVLRFKAKTGGVTYERQ